jgi:hypothetical protein
MTWLLWRQHRVQAALVAALLLAFAVPVWITGNRLADGLVACRAGTTCGNLFQGYQGINLLVDLSVAVPLVIGMFLGATVVGRELETGTAVVAWTQSVTRRRWLVSKLLLLFGLTVFASAVDAALVTWWSNTHNAAVESRFAGLQFDIQGVVPIGYAVFASAVGLAAGVLWRRSLPAMATTIGAFVGVRLAVEVYARPHYMSPKTVFPGFAYDGGVPPGAAVISKDMTLHGQLVSGDVSLPATCARTASRTAADACMSRAGYSFRITYQPADRYWTFQWIEFGIFAALAAVLVVVAVVTLTRRDA